MKTALKIASGVGALSALSGLANVAHAQSSATASAAGTATIVQAISVSKSSDLAFGTIVKPSQGTSTISVGLDGQRTIDGTAVALASSSASRAVFNVTGEGASAFNISVPASFAMTSGNNSLVVTTNSSAATATLSNSAGQQGSATFGIGGSFPLAPDAPSGAYSDSFTVTVSYQ